MKNRTIDIKIDLPKMNDIFKFLKGRGYQIKPYLLKIPAEQGFLVDDPPVETWVFTATKKGEEQGAETLYLNIFEKEIKKILKEFLII